MSIADALDKVVYIDDEPNPTKAWHALVSSPRVRGTTRISHVRRSATMGRSLTGGDPSPSGWRSTRSTEVFDE